MKRILIAEIPPVNELVTPDKKELHHLVQVRRTQPGETIEVLDGKGGLGLARFEKAEGRVVRLRMVERLEQVRESILSLNVLLGFPHQATVIDQCLPALVQLGVNKVILCSVTYGGQLKKPWAVYHQRLDAIAKQALKQCGRLVLPELLWRDDWQKACRELTANGAPGFLFHPGENAREPGQTDAFRELSLAIGPEGGFTQKEVAQAVDAGFNTRAMGPRILEMKTAVVGACYWAQARFGDGH